MWTSFTPESSQFNLSNVNIRIFICALLKKKHGVLFKIVLILFIDQNKVEE